ncbi:MAG: hypothetical protein LBQ95_00440 [Lachnospiraceae bacterium]|jgi:hypothetical protein|nr:hypothetical protein [Lachnospiraceae bacterium]
MDKSIAEILDFPANACIVITLDEFERYKEALPFYRNIATEEVQLIT